MSGLRTACVLISGASGPIGRALLPALQSAGAQVTRLSRANSRPSTTEVQILLWDPSQPIAPELVSGFNAVIHLAGETIMGKWTPVKKKDIRDSRVVGTSNLARSLALAKDKPRVFICSSGIGYYGDRGDELLTENSKTGEGFLPEVCRDWELASCPASDAGIRTASIRTGVVLSPTGGALGEMVTPFKLGLGGKVGSGKQWMSWIDVEDMVGAILHIAQSDQLQGPVNMVSPHPVTNKEFTKTLASVLHRPAIFPLPAFMVKLAFGEMGETLLLGSQRVEPGQLAASGYQFRFNTLRASLEHNLR